MGCGQADKTYKTYKAIICGVQTKYGPHILYYENCPFATVFCGVVFPGAQNLNVFTLLKVVFRE